MNETPKKWFNWKLFDLLAKSIVALVILAMAANLVYQTFYAGGGIPNDDFAGTDRQVEEAAELPQTDPASIFADFATGAWSFGSSELEFRFLGSASLFALKQLPAEWRDSTPDYDDRSLIEKFEGLGATIETLDNGVQISSFETGGCSMVLISKLSVVQVMRIRYPSDRGYAVVEAYPKSGGDETNLMPVADGITQTAVRRNPNGELSSAILEIDQNRIDIEVFWKENGWDLMQVEGIGEQTGTRQQMSKYRCRKGNELIEATIFVDSASDKQFAVLVLLRNDKKLQP